MLKPIHLDIISAEEVLYSGHVKHMTATGINGSLGIYHRHTPLLTMLKPGNIQYTSLEDEKQWMFISGGILEVQPNHATVLADTVIRAEDLDEKKALEAQEAAKKLLQKAQKHVDYDEALNELACAAAQIEIVRQIKKLKHNR